MYKYFRFTAYCLLLTASFCEAGVTGKIVGKVKDKTTKEPLPFVNILIEGTTMGAAADLNGEYFIINVPVGTYTLIAKMMGYDDMKVENIHVSADMTRRINFSLSQTVLKMKEMIVIDTRPIIQRDVTSSSKLVTGKDIAKMPVTSYTDVLKIQTGAIETGREGIGSGGLHIRGGRADEVMYVVDGINTTDPVYGTSGAILSKHSIEEMQLISGGFDAEYGRAMSGVVNVVTKEGRSRYTGTIEYNTDQMFGKGSNLYKYKPDSLNEYLFDQGYNFGFNNVAFTFSGPIPFSQKATFFSCGGINKYNSHLPHNDEMEISGTVKLAWKLTNTFKTALTGNYAYRDYHSYWHSFSRGAWLEETPRRERGNTQLNLKITHSISPKTFYTLNVGRFNTYRRIRGQDGKHYNDFKGIGTQWLPWVSMARDTGWYDPENKTWKDGWSEDRAWRWYYQYKNKLGEWNEHTGEWIWTTDRVEDIIDALNGRYYSTWTYLDRRISEKDSIVYAKGNDTIYYHEFDLDKYIEDIGKYIDSGGDAAYKDSIEPSGNLYKQRYNHDDFALDRFGYYFYPWWHSRNTTKYIGSFNLISQINKYNEVKFGADVEKHFLELTDIRFVNDNPYLDDYEKEPVSASAYISDKIEYEDMVLKLGLRYDWFDPMSQFYISLDSLGKGKEDATPKWQFSPRFGISYAVTDKAVMYANYGHFFQVLNFADIYQNLNADITSGWPTIGNPDLPPQKEIMYEGGFRYAFGPDMALETSAYYKDIKTLLSTRQKHTIFGKSIASYTIFELQDFARVKGIDIILKKRATAFLSGSVSYSFQDAKGTGSSAREAFLFYFYRGGSGHPPKREFPLEYDITHTVKAGLNFYLPSGFGFMSNLNTNVQFSFITGAPYTPKDQKGRVQEVGSKRMPSTSNTDLRIDKAINLGGVKLGVFAVVKNLFNVKNIRVVHPETGEPDDDNDPPKWEESSYETQWEDHNDRYGTDFDNGWEMYRADLANWKRYCDNPEYYSSPRKIQVGIELKF